MEAKSNLIVLVSRDKLTTQGIYPSSLELYDQFDIVTCLNAVERWEESWSFCPVCLGRYEPDGSINHTWRPLH